MGDFEVRRIKDAHDRSMMYQYALNDIEAFEIMLKENMIEKGTLKIGAEQEICLVDHRYDPSTLALDILEKIDDPHFTNELALFNMEINLDPHDLHGQCFSNIESSLIELMDKGHKEAAKFNTHLLLAGILPTLNFRHLQFKYMTPVPRYSTLSQGLFAIRGTEFEINLQGVDEVIMSLGSVLFEACNTSFQLHLQINPDEFVNKHNWSQMIAGPVLSACVNSPMLFGNELWAETRIALFKQSLDTRSSQKYLRKKLPRVYFGDDWLRKSPSELWKHDLMRFPLLLTSDELEDALSVLDRGEIPNLRAINLHNGTTYTWNRMCYGHSQSIPHLRIECRYLPAGPSIIDETANLAFWIGLMSATPPEGSLFWQDLDFKNAKNNFIKGARTGLNSVFTWYGKNISAKELILNHLLPMAYAGLDKCGIATVDINKYLSIIEKRVNCEITGGDWIVRNFRSLSKTYGRPTTEKALVQQMLQYQKENTPVYNWKDIKMDIHQVTWQYTKVEDLMSTDIFSINEEDSIELAKSTLIWNEIHHLPVEDMNGNLVGLITDGIIARMTKSDTGRHLLAKDMMITDLITVQSDDSLENAKSKMIKNQINGLPVVHHQKLVGIITQRDMIKISNFKKQIEVC